MVESVALPQRVYRFALHDAARDAFRATYRHKTAVWIAIRPAPTGAEARLFGTPTKRVRVDARCLVSLLEERNDATVQLIDEAGAVGAAPAYEWAGLD